MKIGIISGSHRQNSQSGKVAKHVEKSLKLLFPKTDVYLLSLTANPLPLWDESVWDGAEKWQKLWRPIAAELATCDGFVVISPEWSGMVAPGLKNFFLFCGDELRHKPGLIVGVSSSLGGAYPINELRTSSYKNTGICYIPDHIIVRHVEKIFNGEQPGSEDDAYMRGRLNYALKILHAYAEALRHVRASGVIDTKTYPNGM